MVSHHDTGKILIVLSLIFRYLGYSIAIFFVGGIVFILYMTWMPNPAVEIREEDYENAAADLQPRLKAHVSQLSKYPMGRNFIKQNNLARAGVYIIDQFTAMGLETTTQSYTLFGDKYSNIIVELPAVNRSTPVLIVGAHYDSVENSPGANDNASGIAALIELGRYLSTKGKTKNRIRLVAFVNEEPPYFQTDEMGSYVYAERLFKTGEKVVGMICLESIGFYTDKQGSQKYPGIIHWLYPDTGNFISFIGNLDSRALVASSIALFRKNSNVPSEGIAAPAIIPGIAWSDHWSFWIFGYNAIMITDTAPYRYPYYHQFTDTPDKLNYRKFAKVVQGIFKVVEGLANKTH